MQIKYVVLIMNQNDKFNQPMLLLLINAWVKTDFEYKHQDIHTR